jgi:hypothetical protein
LTTARRSIIELMSFSLRQLLRRAPRATSFAGASLSERVWATSFAVLGLTTAAGLCLVLLFSQSSPSVPSLGPLPVAPAQPTASGGGLALRGGAAASRAQTGGVAVPGGAVRALVADPFADSGPTSPGFSAEPAGAGAGPGGELGANGGGPRPVTVDANGQAPVGGPTVQPTAAVPHGGSGSSPPSDEGDGAETPEAVVVADPAPAEPSVPTADPPALEPPIVEPETPAAPEPPLEEPPAEEPPLEEVPVGEPPVDGTLLGAG